MIINEATKQFIKIPAAVNDYGHVLPGALKARPTAGPSPGCERVLWTDGRLQLPEYGDDGAIRTR
jgi:hypothetical protein